MLPGMRKACAELAARQGRSMNSEIVDAVARHLEFFTGGDSSSLTMLNEVGFVQLSTRLQAGVAALESLLFDVRDVGLDDFIADQRDRGIALNRQEAIRYILRAYLDERGYVQHDLMG
jgi:hypothetical protein